MAYPALTNTSFIGDLIIIEYLNTMLNLPLIPRNVKTVSSELMHYHCDFAVPDQKISHVPINIDMLIQSGWKLNERVVIMIGTFDILEYIKRNGNPDCLTGDLHLLIFHLFERNVKEIILCTIPPILQAPETNVLLHYYNSYIRICDDIQVQGKTVKVVDIYSALRPDGLLENDSLIPTREGFLRMHEVLREFL